MMLRMVESTAARASPLGVSLLQMAELKMLASSVIVTGLVVAVFLSGAVTKIMLKILRKDIIQYNKVDQVKAIYSKQQIHAESSGWKQIHGGVFCPPKNGMLLSAFVGQGTQLFIMTFVTVCTVGFFSCCWFVNKIYSRGASSQGQEGIFVIPTKETANGSIFEQKSGFTSPSADPL
ncbi:transmembrane 9 superfamily member 2-like isoform X1 [Thalassophryne amazonica]|uniref:transmembrane 9 superfamily member 2-like isoform X1 n=1 Tax=Thalassophryne amazonica TaxID=390379 RepID=UPI00147112D5|nr:transmembrane 9 superfamily member 2-like isoform X1 [Thalassophryne amazonica]XP_034038097.1 transmembrane 9 superfamily member 2-like isoform X1 [Thalassophryne amazonica]